MALLARQRREIYTKDPILQSMNKPKVYLLVRSVICIRFKYTTLLPITFSSSYVRASRMRYVDDKVVAPFAC